MSDYLWFEGVPFPAFVFQTETIRECRDTFVMKAEDTVVLTYPKSGSNWLVEIVCLIHTKGDSKWIQSECIWDRSPWLETPRGYALLKNTEGPRLISSHLHVHLFPKSLFSSKAKLENEKVIKNIPEKKGPGLDGFSANFYQTFIEELKTIFLKVFHIIGEKVIYLIRNPRDVLVSGYFFWKEYNFHKRPKSLQEYLEWFIEGHVPFGSWFEHVRGWMSMRERDNFLLLSYEELKKDTRGTIEKICQFLGKKLEPEELDSVLQNSSFQAMKDNKMSNFSLVPNDYFPNGVLLMRKGISGDWKNHFTVAQAEAFDKIFQEKMADVFPLLFPWE